MMKILVDAPIQKDRLDELRRLPGVLVETTAFSEEKRTLPKERIEDKNILFCMIPPENLDDMKSLEFIQISSAGYSQLFNLGLVEKGIRASNAQGVFRCADRRNGAFP